MIFVWRGQLPSLKNDRDIGVTKDGRRYSRPKQEVTLAIASIRDMLDRFLPANWEPFKLPEEISALAILGAHGVTSIPDADIDNMWQTLQEALAAPREKAKMSEERRKRLILNDDRQVVAPFPIRMKFSDKTRIYNELYIWRSPSTILEIAEAIHKVAILREGLID